MLRTAITLLFLSAISQAATTFDLSTDFSLQHNPNGVWQYGYSASNSLDPKEFRFDGYADQAAPIGFGTLASAEGRLVSLHCP
jgi:hypothetical protein